MEKFKDKALFSTSEVAELMGVSRVTIFNRIKRGEIKADKVGRTYLIPRDEVLVYLEGSQLVDRQKKELEDQVDLVVKEYSTTLRMLGKE